MSRTTRKSGVLALASALVAAAAGCSSGGGQDTVEVVVGYQSKTINTVTAGTLLRSRGFFEQQLAELGKQDGHRYKVVWQDYDAGAPITAQMLADKIDIGSMGDYPLLINGSRAQAAGGPGTRLVSVTGYNLLGALNSVVVPKDSPARTLADLKGKKVSSSVGSASDGTLVQALARAGVAEADIQKQNQQPAVGASALKAHSVDALAQFVAWPAAVVFAGDGRLLYDGAALGRPTLHGVVVRQKFGTAHPGVVRAFLRAQDTATRDLNQHPLAAARAVAEATGLPPEVVYLYNGPNGVATFATALDPRLLAALRADVPFLASVGVLKALDPDRFVDPSYLRDAGVSDGEPARITGTDPVCGRPVTDPALAGELWYEGEDATRPAADPTCLLRAVKAGGGKLRAAYVPDAATGTRWFADQDWWVRDGDAFKPFTTEDGARAYLAAHPSAAALTYRQALDAS
ncbi:MULTISPECIES: ABC transporter substrate-binding protein [Kitasatospora]|uniref:Putative ABC transporter substrate-binding protein n=1 Tax=Kitasatospora setae (strain ATCC 33774 / DSM 43861 / JCM 3304 / KCC A-0304 / NBRC 14216 / KM-6054) TaxID=452652 RepID=E4ND44_KITSK|nr:MULTISPECIES: ABC transporter substrate-binding protein [Kitasatospora]BAJ29125.1 putative ABC transporter substrate-binding protein [Kitasatospora setae KM-6054]